MSDLQQFSRKMLIVAERIPAGASRVVRAYAGDFHEGAVRGTPVDEGYHRSNWVITVGGPFNAEITTPYSPGKHLGINETGNADGAIQQGRAALKGHREGVAIYVTNNGRAIETLNDGYSQQAPKNFVELALQQASLRIALSVQSLLHGGPFVT